MKPWEDTPYDPGPASSDMRIKLGCLTSSDLRLLLQRLHTLATYFDDGGTCRTTILNTIEIVHCLRESWARQNGAPHG